MTFPARPRTMRPMRTLALVLALSSALAACSASSNAPPAAGDAGGDGARDGACDFTREYAHDGGCVPGTADNCNGVRCARGQSCASVGVDGTARIICVSD